MREKTLDFHLELELDKKRTVGALVLSILLLLRVPLSSEYLTLGTTLPSPKAAYVELYSTGSSYFAYGSGAVGVGTTGPGAGLKLDVRGGRS